MEFLPQSIFAIVVLLAVMIIYVRISKILSVQNSIEEFQGKLAAAHFKQTETVAVMGKEISSLLNTANRIDRNLLGRQEPLAPSSPIKPNNWDGMKEAFKGPVRMNE